MSKLTTAGKHLVFFQRPLLRVVVLIDRVDGEVFLALERHQVHTYHFGTVDPLNHPKAGDQDGANSNLNLGLGVEETILR